MSEIKTAESRSRTHGQGKRRAPFRGSGRAPSRRSGDQRMRSDLAALRTRVALLERERLGTTGRTNPDDDDEDPTRRGSRRTS